MRGVGKNRVLLLVDGVPQNDNFNNAIAWVAWGHIPKEVIERIEIVRGPTSALYGSEGMGGVIHIITGKPATRRQTSVQGEAGTADTYRGSFSHSRKIRDNLGFLFAGGYEESDGFYMLDKREPYDTRRYRDAGKVFGKIVYELDDYSNVAVSALYYDHETGKGRKFFYDELQLDQYWINYARHTDGLSVKGLVYLNRADKTAYQDTAGDNYSSLFREEKMPSTYTWGADLQGTIPLQQWATFTLGAAFKDVRWKYDEDFTTLARDAGAEGEQRFISPFASLFCRFFGEKLITTIGARYDWLETSDGTNWDTNPEGGIPAYDNMYGTEREKNFSPKIGIAFHPDQKTTLRASAGKGFRAPSLFELYKVHVRQGGRYYRAANPDLDPEEIWSYDIGTERLLTDTLLGKVTFFQSFAKDYIGDRLINSYIKNGKTYNEYILDNLSEVDIYGIQAELEWLPREDVSFFANYAYTVSKVEEDKNNRSLEGNYLPNDPRHNLHAGIRYVNPRIMNVTVLANYYADIYFDNENTLKNSDYWTVDVAFSRTFFKTWTLFINAENVFDEDYPIFLSTSGGDTIAPGAIYTVGVKASF